ncbi:hypothetical protein AGMMS50230_00500 [Spirochaetia bacterium]|nr:hypothetical protein AGMMS50230_00500 [Spirochaetia bacterium]
MTIEQTVEIPASHRLTIEVPREVPAGKARLTVTSEMELSIGGGSRIPLVSWFQRRREERFRRAVMEFAGCLKDSPAFAGDSVQVIREMRDEWDKP